MYHTPNGALERWHCVCEKILRLSFCTLSFASLSLFYLCKEIRLRDGQITKSNFWI